MTAVDSYVEHQNALPGVVFFSCSGSNDETITIAGLSSVDGVVMTNSDDDELVTVTDITGNVATIGLTDDAGAAATTTRDMYGIAFGRM